MICKLGLSNAFLNGEQKDFRKVGVEQMPMNKVYQFKTELGVITLYPYSSTLALLFLDSMSQFGFRYNSCSYYEWLEYRWLNINTI